VLKFKTLSFYIIIGWITLFLIIFLKKGTLPALLWILLSVGIIILGFICTLIYHSLGGSEKNE
jgi:hypothetical protein